MEFKDLIKAFDLLNDIDSLEAFVSELTQAEHNELYSQLDLLVRRNKIRKVRKVSIIELIGIGIILFVMMLLFIPQCIYYMKLLEQLAKLGV